MKLQKKSGQKGMRSGQLTAVFRVAVSVWESSTM